MKSILCWVMSLVCCMPALAKLCTPAQIEQGISSIDPEAQSEASDILLRGFNDEEFWPSSFINNSRGKNGWSGIQSIHNDEIMEVSVAMGSESPSEKELGEYIESSLDVDVRSGSRRNVAFRAGLVGGIGVEYIRDISQNWQTAVHASSWLLFSEAGADIRYFFRRSTNEGFYIGSGVRVLNSPLIFTLGLGPNLEFGYEKREASGLYFGVGLGATVLYIPHGVSAEGHGFEGVLPGIVIRIGKTRSKY